METNRRRVQRRLEHDGWYIERYGSDHDIYKHPQIKGIVTLPRHRVLSIGVARTIAKKAGWPE